MSVLDEIAAERRRQIEVEGYSADRDDQHPASMAQAAAAYAINAAYIIEGCYENDPLALTYVAPPPRSLDTFIIKIARRDLIRAAALIIAEVERFDRAADVAA